MGVDCNASHAANVIMKSLRGPYEAAPIEKADSNGPVGKKARRRRGPGPWPVAAEHPITKRPLECQPFRPRARGRAPGGPLARQGAPWRCTWLVLGGVHAQLPGQAPSQGKRRPNKGSSLFLTVPVDLLEHITPTRNRKAATFLSLDRHLEKARDLIV